MAVFTNISLSLKKLGISGTFRLIAEKQAKRKRLRRLLKAAPDIAVLIPPKEIAIEISDKDRETVIERADEMLRDENYFFTFLHHLKNIPDPWNYDPIEKKYWAKRDYEETRVHSSD